MTHLSSFEYLSAIIAERLSGEDGRVAELFESRDVFERLRALGQDGDWYHFTPKTFDGWYLVEAAGRFEAYEQDRGRINSKRAFTSLRDAADYFFTASGYVRP